MSIRLSVCPYVNHGWGKRDFLGPLLRYRSNFLCVQIPLINKHLFCKYFVRLSVGNATKGFATYGCFHPCLYITAFTLLFT